MKSINQIRRERLRELVDRYDAGKASRLTDRMGWKSPSLAARYLSESPRNNKPIGDALARDIEKEYGVEKNFLDNLPGGAVQGIEAQLLGMFRELPPEARRALLGYAQEVWVRERGKPQFGPTVYEQDVGERQTAEPRTRARRSPGR